MSSLGPQFIEPIQPNIYYRIETGIWDIGELKSYLGRVTRSDVFATMFFSRGVNENHARLFFNELTGGNFQFATKSSEDITIVKIFTNKRLELGEEYVREVEWENSKGDLVIGPPMSSARIQGATGKEYVAHLEDVIGFRVAHFHTDDNVLYQSELYEPFFVARDGNCIASAIAHYPPTPPLPPPSDQELHEQLNALPREHKAAFRNDITFRKMYHTNPNNFLVVYQIQPMNGKLMSYVRMRKGDCIAVLHNGEVKIGK